MPVLRILTSLVIVVFFISYSFADISFRNYSIDKAKGVAKLEKKNIIVTYSAEWCLPCKLLHDGAFRDVKLSQLLNTEFVSIKAHHDKIEDREWFHDYNISDIPIMLVVNEKGEELTRISGLLTIDILVQTFEQYAHAARPVNPIDFQAIYKDKYKARSQNEVKVAAANKISSKEGLPKKKKPQVHIVFRNYETYDTAKKELENLKSKHHINAILEVEKISDKTCFMLVSETEYPFITAANLFSAYQEIGVDCTIRRID